MWSFRLDFRGECLFIGWVFWHIDRGHHRRGGFVGPVLPEPVVDMEGAEASLNFNTVAADSPAFGHSAV